MWKAEATAETSATAEAVWRAWEDTTHWNSWNPMIRESSLEGPFVAGTRGSVTPAKGPKSPFELMEVQPQKRWSSRAKIPGARLDIIYELSPGVIGTLITMRAEISGLLSPLFGIIGGGPFKRSLSVAVQNLKALAERDMSNLPPA